MEEAVDAFEAVHFDRCLDDKKCNHLALIARIKHYENSLMKNVTEEVAARLEEVKNDWIVHGSFEKSSYTSFIELVFDTAIKFCKEMR